VLVHRIASVTLKSVVVLSIALVVSSCECPLSATMESPITLAAAPTGVTREHAFLAIGTSQLSDPIEYYPEEVYSSSVYLLDYSDRALLLVPGANNIRFAWSPLGSYLVAVSNGTPLSPFAASFTICSTDTGACIEQLCGGKVNGFYEWSPDERYFLTASCHTGGCCGFSVWEGDGSALLVDAECHGCCSQNVGYRPLEWRDGLLLADYSSWGGGPYAFLDTSGLYLVNPLNAEWTLLEARDCGGHAWGCWAPVEPNFGTPEPYYDDRAYSSDGTLLAIAQNGTLLVEEVATGQVYTVPLPLDATVGRIAWSP
jgi:hypothetical protein